MLHPPPASSPPAAPCSANGVHYGTFARGFFTKAFSSETCAARWEQWGKSAQYGEWTEVPPTTICTGGQGDWAGVCNGDSGGCLVAWIWGGAGRDAERLGMGREGLCSNAAMAWCHSFVCPPPPCLVGPSGLASPCWFQRFTLFVVPLLSCLPACPRPLAGGPLIYGEKAPYTLIGVLSWVRGLWAGVGVGVGHTPPRNSTTAFHTPLQTPHNNTPHHQGTGPSPCAPGTHEINAWASLLAPDHQAWLAAELKLLGHSYPKT